MFEVRAVSFKLPLRNPFRIAHGSYEFRENVFIRIETDSGVRYGEAPVVPYYGHTPAGIIADLKKHVHDLHFAYASAESAFSCAAEEFSTAEPVSRMKSSLTVVYDEDVRQMVNAVESGEFSTVKIKAGIEGDIERIEIIRDLFPGLSIRVDANRGWTFSQAKAYIPRLESLGVELIEEPICGTAEQIGELSALSNVPIILDESIKDPEDLGRFAGCADGMVVKIAKSGGPRKASELIGQAEAAGLQVMLSSMVESSLGVACALPLVSMCRWLDLDAPLLLAGDPFTGLEYDSEVPTLSSGGLRPSRELEEAFEHADPFG